MPDDPRLYDAAELIKGIRDEVVRWSGVKDGGRQVGRPDCSALDIRMNDGRQFIITVAVYDEEVITYGE